MLYIDIYTATYIMHVTPPALHKRIKRGTFPSYFDGKRFWVPVEAVAGSLDKPVGEILEAVKGGQKFAIIDLNPDFKLE